MKPVIFFDLTYYEQYKVNRKTEEDNDGTWMVWSWYGYWLGAGALFCIHGQARQRAQRVE